MNLSTLHQCLRNDPQPDTQDQQEPQEEEEPEEDTDETIPYGSTDTGETLDYN